MYMLSRNRGVHTLGRVRRRRTCTNTKAHHSRYRIPHSIQPFQFEVTVLKRVFENAKEGSKSEWGLQLQTLRKRNESFQMSTFVQVSASLWTHCAYGKVGNSTPYPRPDRRSEVDIKVFQVGRSCFCSSLSLFFRSRLHQTRGGKTRLYGILILRTKTPQSSPRDMCDAIVPSAHP